MHRRIPSVLLSVLMVGCATSHQVPDHVPASKLSLRVDARATDTTSRHVSLLINDERCEPHPYGPGGGASRNLGSPATMLTEPVRVAAGKPLYFTTHYFDSRVSQNRFCVVTGIFTPQTNRSYQARVSVSNNVDSCQLALLDVTDGQEAAAELQVPEYACSGKGGQKIRNGQGVQLNHLFYYPATPR